MKVPEVLQGTDLVDCARANAAEGIEVAAQHCGYGTDLTKFEQALNEATQEMGMAIHSFKDLVATQPARELGIEVAPDSSTQL